MRPKEEWALAEPHMTLEQQKASHIRSMQWLPTSLGANHEWGKRPLRGFYAAAGLFMFSQPRRDHHGLVAPEYYVADEGAGNGHGIAFALRRTKAASFRAAQERVALFSVAEIKRASYEGLAMREAEHREWQRQNREYWERIDAEAAAAGVQAPGTVGPLKSARGTVVTARRRRIFNKSKGECHYCHTKLELEGHWHIEHMMPRSLDGGSEDHNLVAACPSCNNTKRDKTDLEFIAELNRPEAA